MTITMTTWNIQNFSQSDDVYAQKLEFLADTLQSLGSDVVALQEVLDLKALQDIADRLGYHPFAATPDGRGNRVAVLSRNAPVQQQEISQWQLPPNTVIRRFDSNGDIETLDAFPRPAYQITVAHNGAQIDIITAHLKSKLLTFAGNFSTTDETSRAQTAFFALELRAAEATTLRAHVTALLTAKRNVVVLGDFNDGPEAATTQIFYGPPGSQPKGPDDAARPNCAFQLEDKGDRQRLFNVTKLVPEDIRWSRKHNGQEELLDHILTSEGLMLPRVNDLRQVPTMTIINSDTPNMIGAHPISGEVIPDHAPVTAAFV
jgi:endonuclease/exonuclease/phosphatase family metal-dependent hydrolase